MATAARLTALVRQVEELPPGAIGAFLVGPREQPGGMVLVEQNRICWTAAAGMSRRLTDILKQRSAHPLDPAAIEALFARCRDEHLPLGETLVAQGVVSAGQLSAALKQHTVESLLALDARYGGGGEWPVHWVTRASGGYHPDFTFAALEVLTAIGASLTDPVSAEIAASHLQDVGRTGCHAIAYLVSGRGDPVYLAATSGCALLAAEAEELVGWSLAALEVSGGFSPLVSHFVVRNAGGGGAVAWRMDDQICAAVCPQRESLANLATMIGNHELPIVISLNLPVLDRVRTREPAGRP